jgi:hypothetical protein
MRVSFRDPEAAKAPASSPSQRRFPLQGEATIRHGECSLAWDFDVAQGMVKK